MDNLNAILKEKFRGRDVRIVLEYDSTLRSWDTTVEVQNESGQWEKPEDYRTSAYTDTAYQALSGLEWDLDG